MTREASIPITDHADSGTMYYTFRYKIDGTDNWQTLSPNPTNTPIIVHGLIDDVVYNAELTRWCAAGNQNNLLIPNGPVAFNLTP